MPPFARPNVVYDTFPDRFRTPDRRYSSYFNQKVLFSKEELDLMSSFFITESFRNYAITRDDLTLNKNGSSFHEDSFPWNEQTLFVYERIQEWTKEMEMEFTWLTPPAGEYRRYRKGDYFVKHVDTPWDHDGLPKRWFTIGIQLNDEYQGGEFVVDDLHTMDKKAGNTTLWGIEVPHEVKLITEGVRDTLVFFVDVETGKIGDKKLF